MFEYDVKQTREKFKRCTGICKDAAMKIKTASGITRFQEDKEYGTWFNKLFNVMKSTANCQPEQSIETDSQNYGSSSDSEERGTNSGKQEKTKIRELVPIHETTKKVSKKREESLNRAMESVQESLKNDATRELLSLLKEDCERQQQCDNGFSRSWRGG